MRVLVTRPREDAARTAEALQDAGYEPMLAPLFRLQPLPFAWPAQVDAVIVTSANAVRAVEVVPEFILKAPLLAVGASTASAAVRAGFDLVRASDGDSGALAQLVRRVVKPGAHVLHLTARTVAMRPSRRCPNTARSRLFRSTQ